MSGVEVERRDGAVWITINRPERRNAYDLDMARAMIAAVEDAADAEAVVLTGAGDRAFCVGQDL
ncbi:enoyl-CoA hydratase/isomerase family protein, partial [uncultured Aeromicrobium sp.]|uniref:enoyl-CoA hydratase/isomerase family protein n=1 Tax=uncultured Aeromicrobium sp. TaxID=337820 RepID=UPI0025E98F09